jgi:hypothetical protein
MQERRRRIIERLDRKEEMFDLARSAREARSSEEELALETGRERHYPRRGFGRIYEAGGVDLGGGGGGGDA